MHTDDDRRPPVTRISEGMRVFDRAGQDVGFVKMVHLGDPQAATSEGGSDGRGLLDVVAGLGEKAEPDLLNPFTERMLRHGYVKIECSGFFAGDAYAPADEVSSVNGDTVHLSSDRASLVKES